MVAAAKQATQVAVALALVLTLAFAGYASAGGARRHDQTPPTTPTNLQVTSTSRSSIAISWSPSTDNVRVDGYTVYPDVTRTFGV